MLMVYLNCTVVTYNSLIMHMVIFNCSLVASTLLSVVWVSFPIYLFTD